MFYQINIIMNTELVLRALDEARYLICNEAEIVCDIELKNEYERIVKLIEDAIAEINKHKYDRSV